MSVFDFVTKHMEHDEARSLIFTNSSEIVALFTAITGETEYDSGKLACALHHRTVRCVDFHVQLRLAVELCANLLEQKPFPTGNKRVAMLALFYFQDIFAQVNDIDMADFVLQLDAGEITSAKMARFFCEELDGNYGFPKGEPFDPVRLIRAHSIGIDYLLKAKSMDFKDVIARSKIKFIEACEIEIIYESLWYVFIGTRDLDVIEHAARKIKYLSAYFGINDIARLACEFCHLILYRLRDEGKRLRLAQEATQYFLYKNGKDFDARTLIADAYAHKVSKKEFYQLLMASI